MEHEADPQRTLPAGVRVPRGPDALHCLTVVEGAQAGRSVQMTEAPLVLGRDASLPFALPDAQVSRHHCELRLIGDQVFVRDLGSTNGTSIDARRIAGEVVLPVSWLLLLGRHVLRHDVRSRAEVAREEELARELERARRYVETLIPPPIREGTLRVEWCFEPCAHLGGDALGYHELEDGLLALYVIDVCGHGVGSALHSASVLNVLRGRSLSGLSLGDPGDVLARLNRAFPMEEYSGMYFSIWYGVLDPASGRLSYASAGHPPALVAGGGVVRRVGTRNPPIGTSGGRAFAQATEELRPGERLYVFSDGAYEIVEQDGRERGLEDFERELADPGADRSPGEARRRYDGARRAARTENLQDDFTLLVIDRVEPGSA